MEKHKLFLSHSSNDKMIVDAFLDFMLKIGLNENDIIYSSSAITKIPVTEDIYEYLNNALSSDHIYVIYFLSDNYYSSPVCLNEMGAVWLKKSNSLNLLLPGFDFEDIKGVVNKNKIGIKLGTCDGMTRASLNEFKTILENLFNISIPFTRWEFARDEFLNTAMENTRIFNMAFSQSYCIDDSENDGCKIIRKDSGRDIMKAYIDFAQTNSKLSSLVVFSEKRNFTNFYVNKKNLCFEAYADKGINCIDVEMKISNINMSYEIYLDEDEKAFKLPLTQFCDSLTHWENVSEVKFVLHRKKVHNTGIVTIKNLRIE